MKRLLKFLFSFLILSFFLIPQVKAADLNIDCPASSTTCSKTGLDPHFFSITTDGYWYPGKSITKTLNLKNSGPETRKMAIKGEKTSGVGNLEDVMHVSIVGGTTVIWSGSVADFYSKDKIEMGTFAPGADLTYNFTVFMSSGAGDEYQNQETVFDLTLGFWGEPIPTSTPGPTATPVPGGDGGGTTVLGASVSAPVCNDPKPVEIPNLTSAVAGVNNVTLTWTEGAGPLTYYLVAYGTSSGNYSFGNPNVGGSGTTSYTVNNLSGGGAYYFAVRAGNGCKPGNFSNELAKTPLGGGVTGPAVGFLPEVLGEAITPSPTPTGEVQGAEVEQGNVKGEQKNCEKCIWWQILLFELIILWIVNRKIKWNKKIFLVLVPLVTYLIFWWLNRICFSNIFYCKYFWLLDLIVFLLYLLFPKFKKLVSGE